MDESHEPGWAVVADHEGAAALIGALLELDADRTYTKRDLCDAAGVAFKDLYLDGTLEAVADAGLLERVEGDGEATYVPRPDHPAFEAARRFQTAAGAPE